MENSYINILLKLFFCDPLKEHTVQVWINIQVSTVNNEHFWVNYSFRNHMLSGSEWICHRQWYSSIRPLGGRNAVRKPLYMLQFSCTRPELRAGRVFLLHCLREQNPPDAYKNAWQSSSDYIEASASEQEIGLTVLGAYSALKQRVNYRSLWPAT